MRRYRSLRPASLPVVAALLLCGCARPASTERIGIAPDGSGFVAAGRPFRPWGFNYDRSVIAGRDVILEDILREEPAKLDRDFGEMHHMGGNVVRIFCQLGEYFAGPGRVREEAFDRLTLALDAAERAGLHVLLVGLCHIRKSATPDWLRDADDDTTEATQRLFWETAARRFAERDIIFAYDIINEPAVPFDDTREFVVGCFTMRQGEPFCYVHYPCRQIRRHWNAWVRERYRNETQLRAAWPDYPREGESWSAIDIPRQDGHDPRYGAYVACHGDVLRHWASRMKKAIRRHDRRHLVTLGALDPAVFADVVDFHCAHLYPDSKLSFDDNEREWRKAVDRVPPGKPIVIEEFYALGSPPPRKPGDDVFRELIVSIRRATQPRAVGFVSFYWGPPAEVFENPLAAAIHEKWLAAWHEARPQ